MRTVVILSLFIDGIDPDYYPVIAFFDMEKDVIKRSFVLEEDDEEEIIKTVASICTFEKIPPEELDSKIEGLLLSLKNSGNYIEIDPMYVKTRGLYSALEDLF